MWVLLTLAAATAGGFLLLKLRVPGGMLVGAIVGAAALNIATEQAYIYPWARFAALVLIGTYVGCLMTREGARRLPHFIGPYLTVMACLLLLNLLVGFAIWHMTDLDLLTSLLCATPGGMSDTPLVAIDMGANVSVVTVMQFVRMLFGMGVLPSLIVLSDRLIEKTGKPQRIDVASGGAVSRDAKLLPFLPVVAAASVGGLIGRWTGIPAGTLSFSLLTAAILKAALPKTPSMPAWLRRVAQVMTGSAIGTSIGRSQFAELRYMVLPAVLLCAAYFACCVLGGLLVHRLFRTPLRESMLFLAPAGVSEMALIAADMGVDDPNLTVLQICRLVGVTLFFPQVFTLILRLMAGG